VRRVFPDPTFAVGYGIRAHNDALYAERSRELARGWWRGLSGERLTKAPHHPNSQLGDAVLIEVLTHRRRGASGV